MLLKLKLIKTESGYEPTSIFHLNGFLEYKDINDVLLRAQCLARQPNIEGYLVGDNEVHFNVDGDAVNFTKDNGFSVEKLEWVVCSTCGLTEKEIFTRSRRHEFLIPRYVIIMGCMYFAGTGVAALGRKHGYSHATVFNARNKSLPSFLLSGNVAALKLVHAVADAFNDQGFVGYCGKNGVGQPRPENQVVLKPEPEFFLRQRNYWGYHGVYQRIRTSYVSWEVQIRNKVRLCLGCFRSPHDAAKAYNDYIIQHGLQRKLNRIHGSTD